MCLAIARSRTFGAHSFGPDNAIPRIWATCIGPLVEVGRLSHVISYNITTPLRLLFRTTPKCKIHFLGPPLKCKFGHWTSPRYRFCGEGRQNSFKMSAYIFKALLKNTFKTVAYILGTSPGPSPPLKGWWSYDYIFIWCISKLGYSML